LLFLKGSDSKFTKRQQQQNNLIIGIRVSNLRFKKNLCTPIHLTSKVTTAAAARFGRMIKGD
jgi:hypothetical protein